MPRGGSQDAPREVPEVLTKELVEELLHEDDWDTLLGSLVAAPGLAFRDLRFECRKWHYRLGTDHWHSEPVELSLLGYLLYKARRSPRREELLVKGSGLDRWVVAHLDWPALCGKRRGTLLHLAMYPDMFPRGTEVVLNYVTSLVDRQPSQFLLQRDGEGASALVLAFRLLFAWIKAFFRLRDIPLNPPLCPGQIEAYILYLLPRELPLLDHRGGKPIVEVELRKLLADLVPALVEENWLAEDSVNLELSPVSQLTSLYNGLKMAVANPETEFTDEEKEEYSTLKRIVMAYRAHTKEALDFKEMLALQEVPSGGGRPDADSADMVLSKLEGYRRSLEPFRAAFLPLQDGGPQSGTPQTSALFYAADSYTFPYRYAKAALTSTVERLLLTTTEKMSRLKEENERLQTERDKALDLLTTYETALASITDNVKENASEDAKTITWSGPYAPQCDDFLLALTKLVKKLYETQRQPSGAQKEQLRRQARAILVGEVFTRLHEQAAQMVPAGMVETLDSFRHSPGNVRSDKLMAEIDPDTAAGMPGSKGTRYATSLVDFHGRNYLFYGILYDEPQLLNLMCGTKPSSRKQYEIFRPLIINTDHFGLTNLAYAILLGTDPKTSPALYDAFLYEGMEKINILGLPADHFASLCSELGGITFTGRQCDRKEIEARLRLRK